MTKFIACEECGHYNPPEKTEMFQGEVAVCADAEQCKANKEAKMEPEMKLHVPERREYKEVTLHMKGGSKVVFACAKYKLEKRDSYSGSRRTLTWTDTKWPDLPRLGEVELDRVEAITYVDVSVVK